MEWVSSFTLPHGGRQYFDLESWVNFFRNQFSSLFSPIRTNPLTESYLFYIYLSSFEPLFIRFLTEFLLPFPISPNISDFLIFREVTRFHGHLFDSIFYLVIDYPYQGFIKLYGLHLVSMLCLCYQAEHSWADNKAWTSFRANGASF